MHFQALDGKKHLEVENKLILPNHKRWRTLFCVIFFSKENLIGKLKGCFPTFVDDIPSKPVELTPWACFVTYMAWHQRTFFHQNALTMDFDILHFISSSLGYVKWLQKVLAYERSKLLLLQTKKDELMVMPFT
jgi:hypothetical protein